MRVARGAETDRLIPCTKLLQLLLKCNIFLVSVCCPTTADPIFMGGFLSYVGIISRRAVVFDSKLPSYNNIIVCTAITTKHNVPHK